MKLIQCRLSSGQRVPLLVQAGHAAPLPVLIPFIYVQLKLRHRAYNTAAAHLRAIQAFYTYAKSRDINIDDAILACHFGFTRRLRHLAPKRPSSRQPGRQNRQS
nr:hypothetical protein [Pseudomonas koreensis]